MQTTSTSGVEVKNKSTVQRQLQTTTNNLEKLSKKTGFCFYPKKSSCTIFTNKEKLENFK